MIQFRNTKMTGSWVFMSLNNGAFYYRTVTLCLKEDLVRNPSKILPNLVLLLLSLHISPDLQTHIPAILWNTSISIQLKINIYKTKFVVFLLHYLWPHSPSTSEENCHLPSFSRDLTVFMHSSFLTPFTI